MLNDMFVIDGVAHAFNFAEDNWYHLEHAAAVRGAQEILRESKTRAFARLPARPSGAPDS